MTENNVEEPSRQQLILRLTLNLDAPFGMLQRAIMRSVDLVAFGLTVGGAANLTERPLLPDVFLQLRLGTPMPLEQLPDEFRKWILASGMRDLIEALEPFLEEVWKICCVLKLEPGQKTSQKELLALTEQMLSFQGIPVSKKLTSILKEYPTVLGRSWKGMIYSIINLRNCLVHRRGIVGAADCDSKGVMKVFWQGLDFYIEHEDGSTSPVYIGRIVEREGMLVRRRYRKEKALKLGEAVHLSTQDFAEIALTLFVAALSMRENFLKLLTDRGIELRQPNAT